MALVHSAFHPDALEIGDVPVGECDLCGADTTDILSEGTDHDETGPYGWIEFRCADHEEAEDEAIDVREHFVQAARLGLVREYESFFADGDPFDIPEDGRMFLGPDDEVSIDFIDGSPDGFSTHPVERVPGLFAEVKAIVEG